MAGCGPQTAAAIIRSGCAQELCTAFLTLSDNDLDAFLDAWRDNLKTLLNNDPDGQLGQRFPALATRITATFPNLQVLGNYLHPDVSTPGDIAHLQL
jgi:Holliday junction resolvase YEN1